MSIVFFTGFPGFLGSELLPRVLQHASDCRAVCLCQSKFIRQALARREEIERLNPQLRGRIELVEGDITQPGLGLDNARLWQQEITEVYHLAAIYDLSVSRDLGMRVNLQGTRHVLDFTVDCPSLRRLHYVSTCYVSGRFPGLFTEADLEKGQVFNNFYEETKYLAEVEVQQRMQGGMPATVYRPAIVVGDSRTGATQKYDGPYYVIRWLLRQPSIAVLPMVGRPGQTRVNLVPRDYVVDAIFHLSQQDRSAGRIYQLADPRPLSVSQLIDLMGQATRRHILRVPCPLRVATFAIDSVPGVGRLMQIPSATVPYFVHPTLYSCDNTLADLADSGLAVPPIAAYVDRMVEFVRTHPEIPSHAMA